MIRYDYAKSILWLVIWGVISCKRHIVDMNLAGYIIGSNDIETISDANRSDIPEEILYASVVLTTNLTDETRKSCSGTLIAPAEGSTTMRILTNHHCFVESLEAPLSATLLPGHCNSTLVFLGLIKDRLAERVVRGCKEGSFRSSVFGDMAVFELNENPPSRFQPVAIMPQDPVVGTVGLLIHFPQVSEEDKDYESKTVFEPKSGVRVPLGQLTRKDCLVGVGFSAEEAKVEASLAYSYKHSCDQERGSSGSALWNVAGKSVMGLNWGGISLKTFNANNPEVHNLATKASIIRDFVDANMQTPGTSNAIAGADKTHEQNVQPSASNQKRHKKSLCGSISNIKNQGRSNTLLIALLMFVPLAIVLPFRKLRE